MGYVDPNRENWEVFKALPRYTPIQMLNLIRFRDMADYPDGHPDSGKGVTGREAYARYLDAIKPMAEASGGGIVWRATFECTVTGPAGEWDEAFVMGYPSGHAFIAMLKDPDYIAHALPHRTAAVADSRLIRFGG